jgi:hypothetical protein
MAWVVEGDQSMSKQALLFSNERDWPGVLIGTPRGPLHRGLLADREVRFCRHLDFPPHLRLLLRPKCDLFRGFR